MEERMETAEKEEEKKKAEETTFTADEITKRNLLLEPNPDVPALY